MNPNIGKSVRIFKKFTIECEHSYPCKPYFWINGKILEETTNMYLVEIEKKVDVYGESKFLFFADKIGEKIEKESMWFEKNGATCSVELIIE